MNPTFRLGRIFGISVGINWSLIAVAVLVAVGLGGERFPAGAPGYSDTAYAFAGTIGALIFFVSVLVHELSHALVGRREGLRVQSITLWLMGGVTSIEGETKTPAGELRVSGSGPLASFVLGVAFLGLGWLLEWTGTSRLAEVVSYWLGFINLVLAAFNVLPGAPLDGGRLLHAFVWWRTGDRMRATTIASRGGRILGLLLVVVGIGEFAFGEGPGGGIWLALIGGFLISAARSEESQEAVRWALHDVRVADLMSPDPTVGPGWFTVQAFLDDVVVPHHHSAFPIQDWNGGLAGVVTLGQLQAVPPGDRNAIRAVDVACPLADVLTAGPDELVVEVLGRQTPNCANGRILVMEGDRLVGIVSPSDVVAALRRAGLRGPA